MTPAVPARTKKPLRLALGSSHCDQLDFNTQIALTKSQIEYVNSKLRDAGQSLEEPWIFGDQYTVGRQHYTIQASISSVEDQALYDVSISYHAAELALYSEAGSAFDLIQFLGNSVPAAEVSTTAFFTFKDTDGSPTIPLPIELGPTTPGTPTVELRGLTLTIKPMAGSPGFTVAVDRFSKGLIGVWVAFLFVAALSDDLPRVLLEQALVHSRLAFRIKNRSTRTKTPEIT